MITGFSIILDGNVIYCSNEDKCSLFETILYIEKLINIYKEAIELNNLKDDK